MVMKPKVPTIIPLVRAASAMAKIMFFSPMGGIRRSVMKPNTFEVMSEDDELAKEF